MKKLVDVFNNGIVKRMWIDESDVIIEKDYGDGIHQYIESFETPAEAQAYRLGYIHMYMDFTHRTVGHYIQEVDQLC